MLHAAAMLAGLFLLSVLITQSWDSVENLALVFGAAVLCLGVAARFGGIGRTPFSAPQLALLSVARWPAVFHGAVATIRAALAADVTLKPALVRVKATGGDAFARAAADDLISEAPGSLVVSSDEDGALIHVCDEDAYDARAVGAVQDRVASMLRGG